MSATPDQAVAAPTLGASADGASSPPSSPGRTVPRSLRRLRIASFVATAALLGFIAYAVTSASHQTNTAVVPTVTLPTIPHGKPAPAFTLARLGGGAPVSLADVAAGRPAIVNFFASWCPDCRAELAAFGAVSSLDGTKVAFVGVDSNDTNSALASALLRKAGDRYPVGVDPNGKTAISFLVNDLPTTFFVNRQGRVVGEAFGTLDRSILRRWVSYLAGPGPAASTAGSGRAAG